MERRPRSIEERTIGLRVDLQSEYATERAREVAHDSSLLNAELSVEDIFSSPIFTGVVIFAFFILMNRVLGGKRISGAEARQMVEGGAMLVDVRTPGEYAAGHIDGAVNIPLNQVPARVKELPKDRPIVVYCRSGNRSGQARRFLMGNGYSEVHNLGPMRAW